MQKKLRILNTLPGRTIMEGQYPFDRPYYLLIDMQTEGSWVGKAIKSELPVEMEIDWVKMYDLVE